MSGKNRVPSIVLFLPLMFAFQLYKKKQQGVSFFSIRMLSCYCCEQY
jgi:hypothetical protein